MRTMKLATLAAAALALAGCATMFTGTTDALTFDANVPGVRLSIDGQYKGELPMSLPMSRSFVGGQQFLARFEKEGYVAQEFKLVREFNTVAILDVSSPITSGGIDLMTGSLLQFSPKAYHVQMLRQGEAATSAEFRRVTELYRYSLVNYRSIQRDLARGGGEHLRTFAVAVCGEDGPAVPAVYEAARRGAAHLLAASTAQEFMVGTGDLLAASGELRVYRP